MHLKAVFSRSLHGSFTPGTSMHIFAMILTLLIPSPKNTVKNF
jgi:hypothetical protein